MLELALLGGFICREHQISSPSLGRRAINTPQVVFFASLRDLLLIYLKLRLPVESWFNNSNSFPGPFRQELVGSTFVKMKNALRCIINGAR
jgi:hypothetical protein